MEDFAGHLAQVELAGLELRQVVGAALRVLRLDRQRRVGGIQRLWGRGLAGP